MNGKSGLELMGARIDERSSGPKKSASFRAEFRLNPGVHVLLLQSAAQADGLILTCCGLKPPARGQALVEGQSPYTSPLTRSHIVSLFAQELELGIGTRARTVFDLLTELSRAPSRAWASLSQCKELSKALTPLAKRPLASLDNQERRSVALELALHHPEPRLAIFYEPWSAILCDETAAPEQRLMNELSRLDRLGCTVVLVTLSQQQGQRYSHNLLEPYADSQHFAYSSHGAIAP